MKASLSYIFLEKSGATRFPMSLGEHVQYFTTEFSTLQSPIFSAMVNWGGVNFLDY